MCGKDYKEHFDQIKYRDDSKEFKIGPTIVKSKILI